MYGLKQEDIIANNELQKHLKPYGYAPVRHTPVFWECKGRDTIFTLVIDEFLVKITSEECAQHLNNALKEKYEITIYWDAKLYISITLKWWYNPRKVQLSMSTSVPDAINKIKHIFRGNTQDPPAAHITPKVGKRFQYSEPEDITDALQQDEFSIIQTIVGIFLYYALSIYNTLLTAL